MTQRAPGAVSRSSRATLAAASARKPRGLSQAEGRARALALDPAALRDAYEAGASTVDLALAHGVSRSTVRVLLLRAGCAIRSPRTAVAVRARASYVRQAQPDPVPEPYDVTDVFGTVWRVTHARPTRHGFPLVLGHRRVKPGRGSRAVILTPALTAHLERYRLAPRLLDLPLGQSLIVRLRRRLEQDWAAETAAWWSARRADLERLSPGAFAARHDTAVTTATVMRHRLRAPRPPRDAWLDARARALLVSERPVAEVAAALGKSVRYVYRLRRRLRGATAQEGG